MLTDTTWNVTNIGNTGISSDTQNRVFQINERLTWLRGRHTLKFGGSSVADPDKIRHVARRLRDVDRVGDDEHVVRPPAPARASRRRTHMRTSS